MFKKTRFKHLLGAIVIGSFAAISTPAMASNEAMLDLLKILVKKGSITAEEYELLETAAKADGKKAESNISQMKAEVEKVEKKTADLPKINTNGKFEITKGDNKFRLTGRLHIDTLFAGNDDGYANSSNTSFRRARIGARGTWAKYWDWKFEFDLEDAQDSDQAIEDGWIKYTKLPVDITIGQRRSGYGMSEFVSSNKFTFIERSFVSDLFHHQSLGVGGRTMGITFTKEWDHWLTEHGYYTLRNAPGGITNFDQGHGYSGRVVWSDYDKEEQTLLHAGISGGHRSYGNNTISRFQVRPNVAQGSRIIDSDGAIAASNYTSFNFNAAAAYKQLWASGEYFYGSFDLDGNPAGDDDMEGFFVQAGYFLTKGDARPYKKSVGSWSTVKPKNAFNKGGWGALEVAVRYDHATLGSAVNGGALEEEGSAFTAALNYYATHNIRLQANYIKAFCDTGECDWDSGTIGAGEPGMFLLRAQTWF